MLDLRAAEARGLIAKGQERQERFEAQIEKRLEEDVHNIEEHIRTIGQDEKAMHSIFEWLT